MSSANPLPGGRAGAKKPEVLLALRAKYAATTLQ